MTDFYRKLMGVCLIVLSCFIFVIFTIWIIIAKLINRDSFLKDDRIYCLGIPLLFPVTFIFAYTKWIAYNYFKHC